MKRTFFLVLLAQPLFGPVLPAQPKLEVIGGTKLSLGGVYEGRTIHRQIVLRNAGSDKLVIDSVRTSCGCTAAKLSSQTIRPGGKITMSVAFDTKDITGKFERTVTIRTNDARQSETAISWYMVVMPVIEVTPRYISFGRVRVGQAQQRTVRLRNALEDSIRILRCTVEESQLSLKLSRRVIAPQQSVELEATLRPRKPGKLLGQVELRTGHRLKPLLKISYMGQIRK